MKTIIDEQGCTTHPYNEPSLEVTVPMTVQGVNLSKQVSQQSIGLLQLSLQVESLHSRIKELETKITELQLVKPVAETTPIEQEKPVSNSKKTSAKTTPTVEA
jgi:phage shock protein A